MFLEPISPQVAFGAKMLILNENDDLVDFRLPFKSWSLVWNYDFTQKLILDENRGVFWTESVILPGHAGRVCNALRHQI